LGCDSTAQMGFDSSKRLICPYEYPAEDIVWCEHEQDVSLAHETKKQKSTTRMQTKLKKHEEMALDIDNTRKTSF